MSKKMKKPVKKECSKCKKTKAMSLFPIARAHKDGYGYWCKKCKQKWEKEKRTKYRKNPEWVEKTKLLNLKNWLKVNYNLTLSEYEELVKLQNGVCAICGKENNLGNKLFVDHCHKTNKVRGLLCQKCNSGVGYLNDDIHLLAKAIEYLTPKQTIE